MINIIILISFLLDGALSIYQETSFFEIIYFRPMFTIVALVLLYQRYSKTPHDYYRICLFTGALYDLIYTNTLLLNMILFPLLGVLIYELYSTLKDTFFNSVTINLIVLTLYHLITYMILFLVGYLPFSFTLLMNNFLSIIITNTIFFILIYSILKRGKK